MSACRQQRHRSGAGGLRGQPAPDLPASAFNPGGGPIFASSVAPVQVYSTPATQLSPRIGVGLHARQARRQHGVSRRLRHLLPHLRHYRRQQPGFSQTTAFVPTLDGFLRPAATLSNPFPDRGSAAGGSDRSASIRTSGRASTFTNPSLRQPYSRRYTAGVQQRLRRRASSSRRPMPYNQCRRPAGELTTELHRRRASSARPTSRDQATINRLTANVANPFAGLLPGTTLNGPTIQLEQLLRAHSRSSRALRITGANRRHVELSTWCPSRCRSDSRAACSCSAPIRRSTMNEATARLNASDPELYTAESPTRIGRTGSCSAASTRCRSARDGATADGSAPWLDARWSAAGA